MMLCEAAAFYKAEGKTLCDAMEDLYRKYGYYKEGLTSIEWKGAEGSELIKALMEDLRSAPADRIGGCEVLAVRDYASGVRTELAEQSRTPTGLPKSDVLYYELSGNAWCCVRPSGTEPKIKFYYGVCGKNANDADERLDRLCKDLMDLTKKKPAFVPNLRLHGRIDRQAVRKEGGFPLFWAGSGAEFLFTGTDLSVDLQASFTKVEPWIAAELNGAPIIRMPLSRGINRISLLRGMTPGVAKHIRLFKETQPVFEDDEHFLCLTAIHADGGEFLPLPDSRYRLEFVGDSLTSGEGVIGARSETDWVPALFSASRTWARMASDLIGADFHVISQSGWGIRSGWEMIRAMLCRNTIRRSAAFPKALREKNTVPTGNMIFRTGRRTRSSLTSARMTWARWIHLNGQGKTEKLSARGILRKAFCFWKMQFFPS